MSHNAGQPRVAVDVNSNAVAIWYGYDLNGSNYSNVTVQSATSLANQNWGAPTVLSSPGIRNPATLAARVAFDSTGNAVALWNTSFDDATFNIESATKPVRGNWTAPVDIASSNSYAFGSDMRCHFIW